MNLPLLFLLQLAAFKCISQNTNDSLYVKNKDEHEGESTKPEPVNYDSIFKDKSTKKKKDHRGRYYEVTAEEEDNALSYFANVSDEVTEEDELAIEYNSEITNKALQSRQTSQTVTRRIRRIQECDVMGIKLYEIINGKKKILGSSYSEDNENMMGKGGQGRIKIVVDQFNKKYVCKKYKKNHSIETEIHALEFLRPEGIIKPICKMQQNNMLILEYIEGKDLSKAEHYRLRKWLMKILKRQMKQLIEIIYDIHQQGYMHGDIKPSNIMRITREPETLSDVKIKLIDLGLTKRIGKARKGNGTRSTMAPEVGLRSWPYEEITSAADWWSVGATMWMVYARRLKLDRVEKLPFVHHEGTEVVYEDYYTVNECPAAFPTHLCELLKMLLALEPSERNFDVRINDLLQHPFFASK